MKYDSSYHLEGAPISTAARGGEAGRFLEGIPWQFGDATGRYKVSTATVHGRPNTKAIECVTGGLLYVPSTQAYGKWSFDLYKAAGSDLFVTFVATANAAWNDAAQNGYQLQIDNLEKVAIQEIVAGTATNKFVTVVDYIAPATWYRFEIERTAAGIFTTRIRGGAFGGWTLVDPTGGSGTNPVTDTTTTTCKYIVLDLDAGDKFANLTLKPLA